MQWYAEYRLTALDRKTAERRNDMKADNAPQAPAMGEI
jgi:hypothetical protein